ncbi:MAG TPA: glycosyltransferase [Candidatus Limnocylindrales bacterium]|nr:glycosyltransferase [Candidatus Limnocylindrales bacterium]
MAERPLRVAFLNASLDIGGSERQMVTLAERLPRDRFQPEFVLLKRRGPLAERAAAADVPIHVVGWGARDSGIRQVGDAARLVGRLRRGRYDIVDAWLFHAYALAGLTRRLTRVPVLIAGRRSLADYKRGFGRAERLLDRLTRAAPDGIVANAEAVRIEAASFEGLDPAQIRVIHNGIDVAAPIDPGARAAIRAGWGFGDDAVVFGAVANYKPGKGLPALIRTMARLIPDVPAARLVVVGEGRLRADLERLVSELGLERAVCLSGPSPDARAVVPAFDVAVQASESEGLPNAVLEAAAAGVPIVATDAGGTREILDGGAAGVLVPVRDEPALAAGMRRLAAEPSLRRVLGERGQAFVGATFGIDRFVRETASLYEELAERKGVRR